MANRTKILQASVSSYILQPAILVEAYIYCQYACCFLWQDPLTASNQEGSQIVNKSSKPACACPSHKRFESTCHSITCTGLQMFCRRWLKHLRFLTQWQLSGLLKPSTSEAQPRRIVRSSNPQTECSTCKAWPALFQDGLVAHVCLAIPSGLAFPLDKGPKMFVDFH